MPLLFEFGLGQGLDLRAETQLSLRAARGALSLDRVGGGLDLLWRASASAADQAAGGGHLGGLRLGPCLGASFCPGGEGATVTAALAGVYAFPMDEGRRWALAVDCQAGCSWIRSEGAWEPVLHLGPSFQILVDPRR